MLVKRANVMIFTVLVCGGIDTLINETSFVVSVLALWDTHVSPLQLGGEG